jgi:transcription antitermination factor NusG
MPWDGVEYEVPGHVNASNWYAAYTKHQHEKTARDFLIQKGFEVLLPLYRAKNRWKDRTKVVFLPVFPCYLFIRADLERKLEILKTPGVFWLVENGGIACEVPESDIDAIRMITRSSAHIEPHPFLKCGELVRVRSGPLTGVAGILARVKNNYRVVLCVDLLQKAVAVEVDRAIVEPIEASRSQSPLGLLESRNLA